MPHEPKQTLDFGDKAKIRVNIYTAVGICVSLLTAGWLASQKLDRLIEGQNRVERALSYKWSVSQMTAWANQLERSNRSLIIPDPTQIRLPAPEMPEPKLDE
jgi:hypothetical protein